MKNTLLFFARHFLYWWIVFLVFRILFLVSVLPLSGSPAPAETLQSLVAGYRLDWSTASYFAVIPFLITAFSLAGGDRFFAKFIRVYYRILVFVVILLSLANIIVFRNWGTLLNNRGLAFAAQPVEMLASVTTLQLLGITLIIILLNIVFNRMYTRMPGKGFEAINGTPGQRISGLLLVLPCIVIGLRGGLQLIPVNESNAAFSNHRILNQVAVNNIWYLGHNLKQSGVMEKNPYNRFTEKQAETIVTQLLNKSDTAHHAVLNFAGQPNVVIILLESWTADIIEPLGGVKGVTPFFSKLCSEGLLFSNIYSSGFRTDQALISVLSGFPSQPNKSIIRYPEKTDKLPAIARELKNRGYATSFYYGGELGFANMNSYLRTSGFDRIISIDDFKSGDMNSKWGVHDQFVFEKQARDLSKERSPFLSVLLTLSTHEPFEVPIPTPFNGREESELFKKSAWYTDHCLENYFSRLSEYPLLHQTVFILLADHGHRLPLNRDYLDPLARKIPMLVWSPLLKQEYRGKTEGTLGGQHDLAATLLSELGMDHQAFTFSNDLLKPGRSPFAYLSLDNAITWLDDSSVTLLPLEQGLAVPTTMKQENQQASAYLQHLYGTFLSY